MEIMNIELVTTSAPKENAEVKYLNHKLRQLEEENKLLLAMLAEAIGRRTVRISEESLEKCPRFEIGTNLGGDILIKLA